MEAVKGWRGGGDVKKHRQNLLLFGAHLKGGAKAQEEPAMISKLLARWLQWGLFPNRGPQEGAALG